MISLSSIINSPVFQRPEYIVAPYTWVGHIPFAFFVIDKCRPACVVELGTHTGNSFFSFCQAVRACGLNTNCYAVDSWEGDQNAGFYANDVFDQVKSYRDKHYGQNVKLIKSYFDDAVSEFENGSIDVLHIDGLHTYEAVKNDFKTWLPKMSPKGIVLFHDTAVLDRNFGVHNLWSELSGHYPSFEFKHSHGLGVLCVGDKVPVQFLEFVNEASEAEGQIQDFFYRLSLLWLKKSAWQYQKNLVEEQEFEQEPLMCELYYDVGTGFCDQQKLLTTVFAQPDGQYFVTFKLNILDGIKQLRFDPGHDLIVINDLHVQASSEGNDTLQLTPHRTNAISCCEGFFVFPEDPQVELGVTEPLSSITFRFFVMKHSTEVLDDIMKAHKNLLAEKKQLEGGVLEAKRLAKENQRLTDEIVKLKKKRWLWRIREKLLVRDD